MLTGSTVLTIEHLKMNHGSDLLSIPLVKEMFLEYASD